MSEQNERTDSGRSVPAAVETGIEPRPAEALKTVGQGIGRLSRRWYENNTVVLILSFIVALVLWSSVASESDEKITQTVRRVPVHIDTASSVLERHNLYPVDFDETLTVDIEIQGSRTVVGNAKAEEFDIQPELGGVTGAETYDLALNVTDTRDRELEIKGVKPETVKIRFDTRAEKTLDVALVLEGVVIPEGCILDSESVKPMQVTVSGPGREISAIAACRAEMSFREPLTDTVVEEVELKLYDADGNEITSPYLSLSEDTVEVTLPVLKKKVVPVTFDYINVPSGFDTNTLRYRIVPNEVELAGPESALASVTELHLCYINLASFSPDFEYTYELPIPEGFIAVDNMQDATLLFEHEDYEARFFTISEFKLINAPEDYDVSIATRILYDVEITGPGKDLEELQPTDLVAEIDMRDVDLRVGQSTVGVKILVTANDTCWASGGTYTAVVTVRSK